MITRYPFGVIFLLLLAGICLSCNARNSPEIVVYTSVDDVFARPIAERFTKETGIRVKLVSDAEETKSTGLMNRLIAEKGRPQADVFWSGDPMRTEILKHQRVSAAYRSPGSNGLPKLYSDADGFWTGFSARTRIILYNTRLVAAAKAPRSVFDLATNPELRGKTCIANPLFGTTSMQAAALFVALGDPKASRFFAGMTLNGTRMVSSNGEVRRRVSEGDCAVGITDSDDGYAAVKDKKPVAIVFPDESGLGTLIVPNAVALIANSPNPEGGKRFIDYLLRPETERLLAESDAAQIPLRTDVKVPRHIRSIDKLHPMKINYGKLAAKLDELNRGFLKDWAAKNGQ